MKTIDCKDCGILLENVSNRTERCKPCAKVAITKSQTKYNQSEKGKATQAKYREENRKAINAHQKKLRDAGYHKQKFHQYSIRDFGCKRCVYKTTLDISALGLPQKFLIYIGKCEKTNSYKRCDNHRNNLNSPVSGCPKKFFEMAEELRALGLDPVELFTFEIITPGDFLTDLELKAEEISFIKLYSRDFPEECVNSDHRYKEEE